jgi:hypothetical protein
MPNFEKYNLSQVKTERFYQLPKYLFEDAYFKKMSAEAKIMYALLKDRFELSLQNEWVDKNNNIYFIFSNKHLCEYLGYAEQKIIIKLKKELIKFNLLTQERVGLNKPNRLYLLKPLNYNIKASHTKELPNSQFQNNEFGSSRTVNLSGQELPNSQSNDTDYNDTDYIKTESNDTDDLNDNKLNYPSNHTSHSNHYYSKFNDDALKFQLLEELPQSIQNYLNNFSVDEIKLIKSVLLKAKTSFNNSIDTYYLLEDMEIEILHVLKRFKAVLIQKNETVEAMQGYLMKSLKSEFVEVHTLNKRRDNLPITSLFNT